MATASRTWASSLAQLNIPDSDITEFDKEVARLKLQPWELASSTALRYWAKRYRNKRYVPEWLLDVWGMVVNPELTH